MEKKTYGQELQEKKEKLEKLIGELNRFGTTLYMDLVLESLQNSVEAIDRELQKAEIEIRHRD